MNPMQQQCAQMGCPGGDSCCHGDDAEGLCVVGKDIHFDGENQFITELRADAHLGSFWLGVSNTNKVYDAKLALHKFIDELSERVVYALPEDLPDKITDFYEGVQFLAADATDENPQTCWELPGRPEYPRVVFLGNFFSIVNSFFIDHPHHGTGPKGWHSTHRCHNKKCVRPDHVYFAPRNVNYGTDTCPGGTACEHFYGCLYPGKWSVQWEALY